jgi:hypothetical protein
MDHHDLPPAFVAPLVNAHGTVRSLDISGAGEEVWRVRESGDLGWGEVREDRGLKELGFEMGGCDISSYL